MFLDSQIRLLCRQVAAISDPDELDVYLADLKDACREYLAQRRMVVLDGDRSRVREGQSASKPNGASARKPKNRAA